MTLAAYWEDLLAEGGTQQGVYYQIDDSASQSTVTFEYLLASLGIQDQYYHFLVSYQTSNPGVVKVYYFLAADGGSGATVAVQGPNGNGKYTLPYPYVVGKIGC